MKNIEYEIQQCQDRADAIRDEISTLSDQCLCAFADWVEREEGETVAEYIDSLAARGSHEDE